MQGHALLVAEERTFAAHGAACQTAGISFIPLAIKTLGGLSDTTADTISSIGRLIGQRFGVPHNESSRQLFHRLAISHGSTDGRHPLPFWTAWSEPPCFLSFVLLFFLFVLFRFLFVSSSVCVCSVTIHIFYMYTYT